MDNIFLQELLNFIASARHRDSALGFGKTNMTYPSELDDADIIALMFLGNNIDIENSPELASYLGRDLFSKVMKSWQAIVDGTGCKSFFEKHPEFEGLKTGDKKATAAFEQYLKSLSNLLNFRGDVMNRVLGDSAFTHVDSIMPIYTRNDSIATVPNLGFNNMASSWFASDSTQQVMPTNTVTTRVDSTSVIPIASQTPVIADSVMANPDTIPTIRPDSAIISSAAPIDTTSVSNNIVRSNSKWSIVDAAERHADVWKFRMPHPRHYKSKVNWFDSISDRLKMVPKEILNITTPSVLFAKTRLMQLDDVIKRIYGKHGRLNLNALTLIEKHLPSLMSLDSDNIYLWLTKNGVADLDAEIIAAEWNMDANPWGNKHGINLNSDTAKRLMRRIILRNARSHKSWATEDLFAIDNGYSIFTELNNSFDKLAFYEINQNIKQAALQGAIPQAVASILKLSPLKYGDTIKLLLKSSYRISPKLGSDVIGCIINTPTNNNFLTIAGYLINAASDLGDVPATDANRIIDNFLNTFGYSEERITDFKNAVLENKQLFAKNDDAVSNLRNIDLHGGEYNISFDYNDSDIERLMEIAESNLFNPKFSKNDLPDMNDDEISIINSFLDQLEQQLRDTDAKINGQMLLHGPLQSKSPTLSVVDTVAPSTVDYRVDAEPKPTEEQIAIAQKKFDKYNRKRERRKLRLHKI